MENAAPLGPPVGMDRLLQMIKKQYKNLQYGYFNPPRERFMVSLENRPEGKGAP
jgi:hypothetical protein